ncbi:MULTISPECIES: hypothetical protein [unclassified Caballeronia]|uniref:hypothetical protein n=1 Tax=unclassified Caballeronia TaxID=2646786 RepID=UPI003ED006EA
MTLEFLPLNTPTQIAALVDDCVDGGFVYLLNGTSDIWSANAATQDSFLTSCRK